jgi:hypothetical protein
MPPEDEENANIADGYVPLHTEDDEDDEGETNNNENIEDFQALEEKGEEKKDNEAESNSLNSKILFLPL